MRRFLIPAALVAIAAATWLLTPLRAAWRSTAHFRPCAVDERVRFEPGAEVLAELVARALPAAIATVERAQFGPFVKPVTIHVCATTESVVAHGGSKSAGGFVLNGRLFISPKPENTAERIPRLLTHELSHLHLEQQLGMIKFARRIPSWFKEGLAVSVASGGGAESVSAADAVAAIAEGRTFVPATSGRLLFERSGRSYDLSEHLWCRQSALLVEFLREKDAAAFRKLVRRLGRGDRFAAAVEACYGASVPELAEEFRAQVVASRRAG